MPHALVHKPSEQVVLVFYKQSQLDEFELVPVVEPAIGDDEIQVRQAQYVYSRTDGVVHKRISVERGQQEKSPHLITLRPLSSNVTWRVEADADQAGTGSE